ncbi:MAG TPA: helix-turn-helix domain-containing protein [Steroidobacteraceae bacterium]|nr:helix-turn-helix domain-containing protein [Steroidobacteraceae bacterium]
MESTRPIRALVRGLDALTTLNLRNGSTVSEIAHQIRLPRTTTYRILETLTHAGYVYRDPTDDRYRLTIRVHCLADGFDDDAWVTQIARPCVDDLGRELMWPVAFASLSGTQMLVRETTDHRSPLAIERFSPGVRLPLLVTAAGRAHLAFCPAAQRESLLEILRRSGSEVDRLAQNRGELDKILEETRQRGYASAVHAKRVSDEISMAVPILVEDQVLAAVVVRFAEKAVPFRTAVERFIPRLRDAAQKIRQTFIEQHRNPPFRLT